MLISTPQHEQGMSLNPTRVDFGEGYCVRGGIPGQSGERGNTIRPPHRHFQHSTRGATLPLLRFARSEKLILWAYHKGGQKGLAR